MIKAEKLNKLYECVINEELITKSLNSYGLNSNDITNLVKLEYLERVERGVYRLLNVDGLYKDLWGIQGELEEEFVKILRKED